MPLREAMTFLWRLLCSLRFDGARIRDSQRFIMKLMSIHRRRGKMLEPYTTINAPDDATLNKSTIMNTDIFLINEMIDLFVFVSVSVPK